MRHLIFEINVSSKLQFQHFVDQSGTFVRIIETKIRRRGLSNSKAKCTSTVFTFSHMRSSEETDKHSAKFKN